MAIDRRNSYSALPQLDIKLDKILRDNVIFEKKVIEIQQLQGESLDEYKAYKELVVSISETVKEHGELIAELQTQVSEIITKIESNTQQE